MCYKADKHRHLSLTLSEKLKDVPDFISEFFDRYKSAATKNSNWGYIRDLLQWLIEKNHIKKENISQITKDDMDKITSNHVIKYFEDLEIGLTRKKNSLESINTKKSVFGAFWGYLFKKKYVSENIIQDDNLKLRFKSEVTQKQVIIPTDEQVEEFICNLNDGNGNEFNIIRNITIVKLIMGSGIRSEELINMDIGDLYLNGGEYLPNRYTTKPFIKVLGKGKKEVYDFVFISQEAKQYVEDYLIQRDIFVRENNIVDNALFLSNERRRMSKTAITNFFTRYSTDVNPHQLRHWVGTKLYEKTKDIVLVQKQLRHSSLETAAKYYVHMSEDSIADAMAEL